MHLYSNMEQHYGAYQHRDVYTTILNQKYSPNNSPFKYKRRRVKKGSLSNKKYSSSKKKKTSQQKLLREVLKKTEAVEQKSQNA